MAIYFISDLHLSENAPGRTQLFFKFLTDIQAHAEALYILGDFFEVWLGFDLMNAHDAQVCAELRRFSEQGTRVFFMRGNRDFLVEDRLTDLAQAISIQEPFELTLATHKILLLHGDALCTRDLAHQRFRRITEIAVVRKLFLLLPASIRQRIARKLRAQSGIKFRDEKMRRNMDVAPETVHQYMERFDADLMIHGHTHEPKREILHLKNKQAERIVLGEWSDRTASILEYQDADFRLKSYP